MHIIFNRQEFIEGKEKEYLGCLPTPYHRAYFVWKEKVLPAIDGLVPALRSGQDCSLEQFGLSEKDFQKALQIGYFTEEELALLKVAAKG